MWLNLIYIIFIFLVSLIFRLRFDKNIIFIVNEISLSLLKSQRRKRHIVTSPVNPEPNMFTLGKFTFLPKWISAETEYFPENGLRALRSWLKQWDKTPFWKQDSWKVAQCIRIQQTFDILFSGSMKHFEIWNIP